MVEDLSEFFIDNWVEFKFTKLNLFWTLNKSRQDKINLNSAPKFVDELALTNLVDTLQELIMFEDDGLQELFTNLFKLKGFKAKVISTPIPPVDLQS